MNIILALITVCVFIIFAVPAALLLNTLDWVGECTERRWSSLLFWRRRYPEIKPRLR